MGITRENNPFLQKVNTINLMRVTMGFFAIVALSVVGLFMGYNNTNMVGLFSGSFAGNNIPQISNITWSDSFTSDYNNPGFSENKTFTYYVKGVDFSEKEQAISNKISIQSLTIHSGINITWVQGSSNVYKYYNVYRSVNNSDFVKIAKVTQSQGFYYQYQYTDRGDKSTSTT